MDEDLQFMQLALDNAVNGMGFTAPNPMVGAVVVKNEQVIGVGYHQKYGEAHAEVNAINDAGIENCKGATIYVTLEPCSTYGKTPPCTDLILKSGIIRVVIGCLDPNPVHAGRAVKILEDNDIIVKVGVLEKQCIELNEGFFKYITDRLPLVTLKMAMTLDGKIACHNGESKWITSENARARVQYLRRSSQAILVGANTIRQDRPSLFARNDDGTPFSGVPLKRYVASNSLGEKELAEIYPFDTPKIVRLNSADDWEDFLYQLADERVMSLLIEGGGELAASALKNQAVDIVEFHIAPKILGGRDSRPVIGGANPISLDESISLDEVENFSLGDDFAIRGKVKYKHD
ncbi:MAG: bifunctional diaminohydroxyphosphoribosylaminopyrimidine deaminase/5-amino-6-(5-phosphoribosylamino)uracil reductase RibD [Lentisphaeria bacterium]|nr:bifunctional diaminohydroxyphosphoribosylaminopyrimidine deaminase/5-amino-6-(5-phosphoribosylamino)uracil reductase RibD [Lentisphaeria bacterium]